MGQQEVSCPECDVTHEAKDCQPFHFSIANYRRPDNGQVLWFAGIRRSGDQHVYTFVTFHTSSLKTVRAEACKALESPAEREKWIQWAVNGLIDWEIMQSDHAQHILVEDLDDALSRM